MIASVRLLNVSRDTGSIRSLYGLLQKYLVSKDSMPYVSLNASCCRMFSTKIIRLINGKSQIFLMSNKTQRNVLIRQQQTNAIDINTNVKNNVILYKYDEPGLFRKMRIFACLQLFCWSVIGYYSYTKSFFSIFNTDISLKEYANKYAIRLPIFLAAVIIAPAACVLIWYLHVRSIKYLILNKGGKNVTLITYHPFKKDVKQIQPIEKIYSKTSRMGNKSQMVFKVANHPLYYLLDLNGSFVNEQLFDHTVGLKRKI